jgi:hypothetical protein
MMSAPTTRLEHDLLGNKEVPAAAYYGVQTARALENFHISGVELRLYPNFIKALAMVKLAAAPGSTTGNSAGRLSSRRQCKGTPFGKRAPSVNTTRPVTPSCGTSRDSTATRSWSTAPRCCTAGLGHWTWESWRRSGFIEVDDHTSLSGKARVHFGFVDELARMEARASTA